MSDSAIQVAIKSAARDAMNETFIRLLTDENTRLRKALEKMRDLSLPDFMGPYDMVLEFKIIARAALEGK